jgi:6-pyruvoyltetrahydropterin/6-carboxytetrahydropterin synthase
MEHFHIRIANDDLVFSAAHFITYGSGECERLHGHNYRVAAEVHGPLAEGHYVVDFLAVQEILRAILLKLDHRVLLPSEHPAIRVSDDGREVGVTFARRRWVFPSADCLLLPIANTTAELLAQYIGRGLLDGLTSRGLARPELVRLEVEESVGQRAVWQWSPP